MSDHQPVTFHGGIVAGAVPLVVFLTFTLVLVVFKAPTTEGMILAAMVGISAGMFFAKRPYLYSERVFSLMANRVATVAIVCWLWAGAFAGILSASGLVEAIVWLSWQLDVTGAAFVVATFFSAALFAVFVGTGLGTVVGFTAVMYPAGLILGANPAALMGAIISGGAFGDNLAPISDTTIVSAATQEADVPGVVRSRLKYVLIAGGMSAVLFYVLGTGGPARAIDPAQSSQIIAQSASPKGLPMLIPPLLVFVAAVSGHHFLTALTTGIIASAVIVVLANMAAPMLGMSDAGLPYSLFIEIKDGVVGGAALEGIMGLVPTAILTLLLVTAIGLMADSGLLNALLGWLEKRIARTTRGAEAAIVALISFTNLCVSVNTVALVTAGPLANELRRRHNIHPYRSANLLDTISCSFPYILPYSAIIPAAVATQQQVQQRYPWAEVMVWGDMAPYAFYAISLFVVMVLAVVTGYGRREGESHHQPPADAADSTDPAHQAP